MREVGEYLARYLTVVFGGLDSVENLRFILSGTTEIPALRRTSMNQLIES